MRRADGGLRAWWVGGTVGVILVSAAALQAWGEVGSRVTRPRYHDRARCGVVDATRLAPRVHLQVDLDGDGEREHYIANWGGVERHHVREGSHPPVLVRDATIFRTTAAPQFSCIDLVAVDADGDSDLDLVFGSPRELVVLENRNGRLSVTRREPQDHPSQADIRVRVGRDIELVAR